MMRHGIDPRPQEIENLGHPAPHVMCWNVPHFAAVSSQPSAQIPTNTPQSVHTYKQLGFFVGLKLLICAHCRGSGISNAYIDDDVAHDRLFCS